MRVEKYTIERDKDGQIYSERRTMKVDTGFWNEKGEYIEQIEEITMEEEKEIMKCFELLQENKKLKEEIWQLQHRKMWNKEATLQADLLIRENERLKKENKENVHYLACMTNQRNKLKFALEEIFNLCNKNITDCDNCNKQECAICNKAPSFSAKIIKIINEVIGEQE